MWAFTTVLAGTHSTRTVATTHTRSSPWVRAHPHPSHQQRPVPHLGSPPHLQHFLSFPGSHLGSHLHLTFRLYLTVSQWIEFLGILGTEGTQTVPSFIISPSRDFCMWASFRFRKGITIFLYCDIYSRQQAAIQLLLVHSTNKEIKIWKLNPNNHQRKEIHALNWTVRSYWKV